MSKNANSKPASSTDQSSPASSEVASECSTPGSELPKINSSDKFLDNLDKLGSGYNKESFQIPRDKELNINIEACLGSLPFSHSDPNFHNSLLDFVCELQQSNWQISPENQQLFQEKLQKALTSYASEPINLAVIQTLVHAMQLGNVPISPEIQQQLKDTGITEEQTARRVEKPTPQNLKKIGEKEGGAKAGYLTELSGGEKALVKQGDKEGNIFPRLIVEYTISPVMREIVGIGLSPENDLIFAPNNQPALLSPLIKDFQADLSNDPSVGSWQLLDPKQVKEIQNEALSLAAGVYILDIDRTTLNRGVVGKGVKVSGDFDYDFALTDRLYAREASTRSAAHFINSAHLRRTYGQAMFLTTEFAEACEQIANKDFKPLAMAVDGKVDALREKIDNAPNDDAKNKGICAFMRAYHMLKYKQNSAQMFESDVDQKLIDEYQKNKDTIYKEYGQLIKSTLQRQQQAMATLAITVRLQKAIYEGNAKELENLLKLHPEFTTKPIEWLANNRFDAEKEMIPLDTHDRTQIMGIKEFISKTIEDQQGKQKELLEVVEQAKAVPTPQVREIVTETQDITPEAVIKMGENVQKLFETVLEGDRSHFNTEQLVDDIMKEMRNFIPQDQLAHYHGRVHELCVQTLAETKDRIDPDAMTKQMEEMATSAIIDGIKEVIREGEPETLQKMLLLYPEFITKKLNWGDKTPPENCDLTDYIIKAKDESVNQEKKPQLFEAIETAHQTPKPKPISTQLNLAQRIELAANLVRVARSRKQDTVREVMQQMRGFIPKDQRKHYATRISQIYSDAPKDSDGKVKIQYFIKELSDMLAQSPEQIQAQNIKHMRQTLTQQGKQKIGAGIAGIMINAKANANAKTQKPVQQR